MPYVDQAKYRKVVLPSSKPGEEYWVELDPEVPATPMLEASDLSSNAARVNVLLLASIKNWNLTGKDGAVLQVNAETIKVIKGKDLVALLEIIEVPNISIGKKKTSSAS